MGEPRVTGHTVAHLLLRQLFGVNLKSKRKLPKDVHQLVDRILNEIRRTFDDKNTLASLARVAYILKNAHKDHSELLANAERASASLRLRTHHH